MKRLATLALLLAVHMARAQDIPIIEIDSITGHAKGAIPYDRPFILKLKADKKPLYVNYVTSKRNVSWEVMLQESLTDGRVVPSIPNENFWVQKDGKVSYLYIRFGYHPYYRNPTGKTNDMLRPSRNIGLIIPALDEDGMKIMEAYHTTGQTAAEAKLADFGTKHEDFYGIQWSVPSDARLAQIYLTVKPYFVAIDGATTSLSTAQAAVVDLTDNSFYLKSLLARVVKDTTVVGAMKYGKKDLIRVITNIQNITPAQKTKLLKGESSLLEIEGNKSISIQNLKASLDQLQQLTILHQSYNSITHLSDLSNFRGKLEALTTTLDGLLTLQKTIAENKEKIREAITLDFIQIGTATGTSNIYSFETRSSLRIVPDFGLVYYGFQKDFQGITPYLGFQINLRSMDKNIPFRVYPNRKFIHRLTLGLGYTLVSVAEDGKRDDFFNGKGALLMGAGVKFNHAMKFTFGTMWFLQENKNPIVSSKSQAFTPYAGLSIDLDLRKFMNDFTTLIPKK